MMGFADYLNLGIATIGLAVTLVTVYRIIVGSKEKFLTLRQIVSSKEINVGDKAYALKASIFVDFVYILYMLILCASFEYCIYQVYP